MTTSKKLAKNKQLHSLSIHFLRAAIVALENGRTKSALFKVGKAISYLNIKAK